MKTSFLSKIINTPYLFVLGYFLVFASVYSILYLVGVIQYFPTDSSLLHWDAFWYQTIVKQGYSFDPNHGSNVAFFPFFPYVWKFFGFGPLQISFFNLLIFGLGLTLLFKKFSLNTKEKFYLISSAPLIFCFLPYAESLFFLFSVLLLIGFHKNNFWLICLGFLGAGLSRSAIVIFFPALITLIILRHKSLRVNDSVKYLIYFLVLATTLGITSYIQYLQTGEFFGYQQTHIHWNHYLQFPVYPLNSWDSLSLITDASSLVLGFFCGIELFILLLNTLKVINNRSLDKISNVHIFCLAYVFAISAFIFLFQGGDLHSLNRYVLGTVFFIFVFQYIQIIGNKAFLPLIALIILFLVFSGIFFGDGNFGNVQSYFRFLIFFVCILTPLFLNKKVSKKYIIGFYLCILLSFCLQIHYFHLFLSGHWIG